MTEPGPFTIGHFVGWVSQLTLDNGELFVLEPFQRAFVEDVLARREDGTPKFRECWLVIPEGNGKTTLLAAMALYHLKFQPDATIGIAASAKDQARILYRQAAGLVHRGGAWGFRALDGYRHVTHKESNGIMECYAASERTGDGVIPSLCILDELHRHDDLRLYETWRGKLRKRNAQLWTISTAGEPGGEFEETRDRIRQTAGEVARSETFVRAEHPALVLHEWAVPEDGDVEDFGLVARANPFSGITAEMLAEDYASPTMTWAHWRRMKCNLPTRSTMAAIQEKEWFAAVTEERIPEGERVWVGLDFGWEWDTTAIVPLWVRDAEFRLFGPARVLVPPRRSGESLDSNEVKRALIELHSRNPITTVVCDKSWAGDMLQWIEAEIGSEIIDHGTSNAAAVEDYKRFMEALREGWIRHAGDPDLTRHALNAIVRILPHGDAVFYRHSQTRQGGDQDSRVIDALIAAAMVHTSATYDLVNGELLVATG